MCAEVMDYDEACSLRSNLGTHADVPWRLAATGPSFLCVSSSEGQGLMIGSQTRSCAVHMYTIYSSISSQATTSTGIAPAGHKLHAACCAVTRSRVRNRNVTQRNGDQLASRRISRIVTNGKNVPTWKNPIRQAPLMFSASCLASTSLWRIVGEAEEKAGPETCVHKKSG